MAKRREIRNNTAEFPIFSNWREGTWCWSNVCRRNYMVYTESQGKTIDWRWSVSDAPERYNYHLVRNGWSTEFFKYSHWLIIKQLKTYFFQWWRDDNNIKCNSQKRGRNVLIMFILLCEGSPPVWGCGLKLAVKDTYVIVCVCHPPCGGVGLKLTTISIFGRDYHNCYWRFMNTICVVLMLLWRTYR